jgi:hypothetical protein
MRNRTWLIAIAAALALPVASLAQQAQSSQGAQQSAQPPKTQTQSQTPQKESLAEAARKAREKDKTAPKAAVVFTNDNIPTSGRGVSVVGAQPAPSKDTGKESTAAESKAAAGQNNDEAMWRKKFADVRQKVAQDEQELSIMQRELSELNLQYYPDPQKALKQSVDRSDIIKKTDAIAAKQKELDADKQALSDLEDQLRAAGGDPGWARP